MPNLPGPGDLPDPGAPVNSLPGPSSSTGTTPGAPPVLTQDQYDQLRQAAIDASQPYVPPDYGPPPDDTVDEPPILDVPMPPEVLPPSGLPNPLVPNPDEGPPQIPVFGPGPPVLYGPGPPEAAQIGFPDSSDLRLPLPQPKVPPDYGRPSDYPEPGDRNVTPPEFPGDDYGIYGPYIPGKPYRKRTRRGHRGGKIPKGGMDQSWPGYDYGRFPRVQFPERRKPGAPPIYRFPGPILNAPPEPKAPDQDEPDRERPPLFPPDEEPANDTSIRRPPVQQVEPVRVPDPAGVRAPFPGPPPRAELPGVPPLQVPKPEPPQSKSQPQPYSPAIPRSVSFPAPLPLPSTIPKSPSSPVPSVRLGTTTIGVASSLAALLLLRLLLPHRSRSSPVGNAAVPVSTTTTSPVPVANPSVPIAPTAPGVLPSPVGLPSPVPSPIAAPSALPSPLTGLGPLALESGQSCETPTQRRSRQQRNRDNCERFITITIPKHKRRVCAAEAGRFIGRKAGKAIGRAVGRVLRGKPLLGSSERKTKKRREGVRVTRGGNIELPGGIGIEIPKQMRPKLPGRIPRL